MKDSSTITSQPGIKVNIMNLKNGLSEYENVIHIKIISKTYNLIIMKDYLPLIGEVEGNIEIRTANDNLKLDDVIGYYIHKHNQFDLFLKDK